MYSAVDFDPFTADDALWATFKAIADESTDMSGFKMSVRQQCSRLQARYVLLPGSDGKAGLALSAYIKQDRNGGPILHLIFYQHGLGQLSAGLLSEAERSLRSYLEWSNTRSFVTVTNDPLIKQMIERLGSKTINVINYYQLNRENFNRRLLNTLGGEGFLRDQDLTIEIHEYVPERLSGVFADLMTSSMNDIIRSDAREVFGETQEGLERKLEYFRKTGIIMLTGLLFDRAQTLAALSFVLVFPDSTTAKQELTGVKKEYRVRKLGTFLKAAVTEEAFLRYPHIDRLETNCYSANLPIIGINLAMGYTLKESRSQCLVTLENS